MKKIVFVTALFLTVSQGPLTALLPPLYQSMEEFKALEKDKQLTEKLGSGEAIVSITRFDKTFTVLTTRHKMLVDIVYEKPHNNGPAKFHFVFHDPQPR